ncbi:MAG: hypothetical protein CL920_22375 [Deltaproteobacteria bacterium]|nr:hypothetical protein [Deltaproteobacteria bacterium]MBU51445.1 hypothetical protein [Deltaproteobacteria bacterium]
MKKIVYSLIFSTGMTLFAGLGVVAFGLTAAPSEADAYCRTYYRRSKHCYYRFGRRYCTYRSRRYTSCRPRCSVRRFRRKYCRWVPGRNVRSRHCRTRRYYRRGYRYRNRRCYYTTRYVPGYRKCSYRWYSKRVCN